MRGSYEVSNYIMDLRTIVGHRTLLQVGASIIVEDDKGRILLQKRTDNHCWGYAGGAVELDEKVVSSCDTAIEKSEQKIEYLSCYEEAMRIYYERERLLH